MQEAFSAAEEYLSCSFIQENVDSRKELNVAIAQSKRVKRRSIDTKGSMSLGFRARDKKIAQQLLVLRKYPEFALRGESLITESSRASPHIILERKICVFASQRCILLIFNTEEGKIRSVREKGIDDVLRDLLYAKGTTGEE
jgi:hypothetical protein